MSQIRGTVIAISHVFYLSGQSKSFWLQIQEESGNIKYFMVTIENTLDPAFKHIQLHPESYYGRNVHLKNLAKFALGMAHGSIKVYSIQDNSSIFVSESISKSIKPVDNLVNLEGKLCSMIDCGKFSEVL